MARVAMDSSRLVTTRFGRLTLDFSEDRVGECQRVEEFLSQAKKPAFCTQPSLAYPWLTQYPTILLDDYPYVHKPALAKGVMQGGPEKMVREGYFETVVIDRHSDYLSWVDPAKYRRVSLGENYFAFERATPSSHFPD